MKRQYRRWRTQSSQNAPTYKSWWHMVQRCTNPDHVNFKNYGARGIQVCARWLTDFDAFVEDMGLRSGEYSIERKDTNGDYEPDNCEWILKTDQPKNARSNVKISYGGRTQNQSAWARELGISKQTLRYRLQHWPIDRVLGASK